MLRFSGESAPQGDSSMAASNAAVCFVHSRTPSEGRREGGGAAAALTSLRESASIIRASRRASALLSHGSTGP